MTGVYPTDTIMIAMNTMMQWVYIIKPVIKTLSILTSKNDFS